MLEYWKNGGMDSRLHAKGGQAAGNDIREAQYEK